ncbi:hypothetical protein A6A19_08755 [Actinobacillus delphinicola]|uniref:GTPase n=1 Tax=Actinobacillus delphinicola TaxID=51161 RepID=UPI002443487A|nr:GTPase [Actinobacillus delphinicola]MDG6898063.1 hypothetical protein [Actinobacillus delphinicola]
MITHRPQEIYEHIRAALDLANKRLQLPTDDEKLAEIQKKAQEQIAYQQGCLQKQCDELEQNAEWNKFTIAFYGETNAGKSTLIETLRILYGEPTKLTERKQFTKLQDEYQSVCELMDKRTRLDELPIVIEQYCDEIKQQQDNIADQLRHYRTSRSLWQKFLGLFRPNEYEKEIFNKRRELKQKLTSNEFIEEQKVLQKQNIPAKTVLLDKTLDITEQMTHFADGSIMGDGRSDYTRETTRYKFASFDILDVPGIEGKEESVMSAIMQAMQKAHLVFYISNKSAPPQDGTLQTIKQHLGALTEVWALYNKRITNVKHQLQGDLLSDGDKEALDKTDEMLRINLGDNHFQGYVAIAARPAFLAVADYLTDADMVKRREKNFQVFNRDELLKKTGINDFQKLLADVTRNADIKIHRANVQKVMMVLNEHILLLDNLIKELTTNAQQLLILQKRAIDNLDNIFKIFVNEISNNEYIIGQTINEIRKNIYGDIKGDINNDTFKSLFECHTKNQLKDLEEQLPQTIKLQVQQLQQQIQKELHSYADKVQTLNTLNLTDSLQLAPSISFNINIDNGVSYWGLAGGLLGLVLAPFTGGTTLWVAGVGAVTALISFGKAVISFFSSSYKQSQQRKAVDENLRKIEKQLKDDFQESIEQMENAIKEVKEALRNTLCEPYKQALLFNGFIEQARNDLFELSNNIQQSNGVSL